MSKLKLPAVQDIARLIGVNDDDTEQRLHAYYTAQTIAGFNYGAAQRLCRYAFAHMMPLTSILEGCKSGGPVGVRSNADVLRLVWDATTNRSVVTYGLKPKMLALRRDLVTVVAPPFYFVEDGKAYVYWLQPRKGHALSLGELSLLASMVKATFLVDDFQNVGFEVCDLSANSEGDREARTYHLESFQIVPEAEIAEKLQGFARAYDKLVARGVRRPKRPPKQRPTEPGLFDDEAPS